MTFPSPLPHREMGIYARCLDWSDWFDVASHSKKHSKNNTSWPSQGLRVETDGRWFGQRGGSKASEETGRSRVIMQGTRAFAHVPSACSSP